MSNTERLIRELYAIFTVQFNTQSQNAFENVFLVFISSSCQNHKIAESQNVWKSQHFYSRQSHVILHVLPSLTQK